MSEPTSALTFQDLIIEVAQKLGTASYGDDGDEAIQIPSDVHDLAEAKRMVNNAIRMFIADAPPPNGWRWTSPVASITLWPDVDTDEDVTVTAGAYDTTNDETILTASEDVFYESMELKTIVIDGVSYTIKRYISATSVAVVSDASAVSADTFSIASNGNFTMPRNFGGEHAAAITFAAGTDQAIDLSFVAESKIREWRQSSSEDTGDPYWAAIRIMGTGSPRRRWELMTYPTPNEAVEIELPYVVGFDKLVDLTDVPPSPIGHDEAIKAACRAMAEKDIDNAPGHEWSYYRTVALANSYRIDAASAPKTLGYFGSGNRGRGGIHNFRNHLYQRPTVTFHE